MVRVYGTKVALMLIVFHVRPELENQWMFWLLLFLVWSEDIFSAIWEVFLGRRS